MNIFRDPLTFFRSLSANGYLILALLLIVLVSFYSYLWKNFRTVAWIVLALFFTAVFYFGFGQGRHMTDFIIQVNGLNH